MKLVTVKTFEFPHEAQLWKASIENHGIQCVIFDENMMGLNPLNNYLIGGVKLKVREEDEEIVLKIISEIESKPLASVVTACPKCNSHCVELRKSFAGIRGIISLIISVLVVVYPIYIRKKYVCLNCGNRF